MDSASPSILNAKPGILSMETVSLATLDISYPLMEDAPNHPFKPLLMLDALVGVQISKHALSAQIGSSSILMENAKKSQTFVLLGVKRMDSAPAAILDTILLVMDHAVFHLLILIPKTSAVLPGTGTSKFAFNALTIGSSTKTTFASLFPINAQPSITPEPVNLATRATTSTTENASSLPPNKYPM